VTVLDLSADAYHADATDGPPTLSASIARILCAKTPLHAWAAHPRLNPEWEPRTEDKFDIGVAMHSLLLQGVDLVHVCHYDDWRTKDAREARDTARQHGRIPLLAKQWGEVERMLDAVRGQLAHLKIQPAPFANGTPETTIVWDEDGVRCRARLDWIHDGALTVDDLKTTSASAEPAAWQRMLYGMGADIQAAFYVRGVQAVYGVTFCDFRWIVAETYPPYALSVIDLAPSALALANEKVEHALAVWKRCLETDSWPGYPARVASVDAPGWEEARWMERQAMAQEVAA
jgi:hypothetical protein